MKKIYIFLLILYFALMCVNINSVPLFVGDEQIYAQSVTNILYKTFDINNHPLLAKTIWALFVYISEILTGKYIPFFWRLGTMLCSLGILIIFFKTAKIFFTEKISLIATITLAVDPMYFAMSRIMQPDIPAIFFGMLALYFYLNFLKTGDVKGFYFAGITGGLSLAAKMYALVPLFTLPFIIILFRHKQSTTSFSWRIFAQTSSDSRKRNSYKLGISKLKSNIKVSQLFIYFILIASGFVLGNGMLFFLKPHVSLFKYIPALIISQSIIPQGVEGYLISPASSWFLIPQILTLFRVYAPGSTDKISEILVFQNPFALILTIPSFLFCIYISFKDKTERLYWISILWSGLGIYLLWFFGLHLTYYYYILPLIPLIILFIYRYLQNFPKIQLIFFSLSIAVFIIYFPLLNGLEMPKKYDQTLFKYSLYDYPFQNRIFCKKCSPRTDN